MYTGHVQNMAYKLRPETAESLFVLHHVTGNPVYREWGWKIYQAIEKYVRPSLGASLRPNRAHTPLSCCLDPV
jgi:hypothetical protein